MSDPEASQEKRRAKSSLRQTPPLAILVLFCTAFLLGQFDEADFAGWQRLAAIWTATLGFCLLAVAIAYSFTRLRKDRPGPLVSKRSEEHTSELQSLRH